MFIRGIALCLALGLVSTVSAQSINITLDPPGGTFGPGEVVNVDVFLTLNGTTGTKLLRHVQLDVTDSHADLLASDAFPVLGVNPSMTAFWDFTTITGCGSQCGINHNIEPIPTGARTNIGSITYLGLVANAAEQLGLTNGAAFRIGRVTLTMPQADGDYLYSVVGTGAAPDAGARVVYGFGVLGGDDQVVLTRAAGITGGMGTFTVGIEPPVCTTPVNFVSALPSGNGNVPGNTLWRTTKNLVKATLSGAPSQAVAAADIEIVEMLPGAGNYGPNLAGSFTISFASNVISIQDNAATLQHRKWYRIRTTGINPCYSFDLCMPLQMGDANGDRFTNATDLGVINASIPTFPAGINDGNRRRDINGDNFINATDLGAANAFSPSLLISIPTGHTCP